MNNKNIMGIGDWGLGIGDWEWGLGPIPNPQSPLIYLIINFFLIQKIKIIKN